MDQGSLRERLVWTAMDLEYSPMSKARSLSKFFHGAEAEEGDLLIEIERERERDEKSAVPQTKRISVYIDVSPLFSYQSTHLTSF